MGVSASIGLAAAQDVIDAVREVNPQVPIIIAGQAAITTASANLSGVTAWASDGPEAVALIESLAKKPRSGRHRFFNPRRLTGCPAPPLWRYLPDR